MTSCLHRIGFPFRGAYIDLPSITREILSAVSKSLSAEGTLRPDCPVIFGYAKGKSWHRDAL